MKKLILLLLLASCTTNTIEIDGTRDLTGHTAIMFTSELPIDHISVRFHEQGEYHSARTQTKNGHIEMKPGWYTISKLTDGKTPYRTVEMNGKILSLEGKVILIRIVKEEVLRINILE